MEGSVQISYDKGINIVVIENELKAKEISAVRNMELLNRMWRPQNRFWVHIIPAKPVNTVSIQDINRIFYKKKRFSHIIYEWIYQCYGIKGESNFRQCCSVLLRLQQFSSRSRDESTCTLIASFHSFRRWRLSNHRRLLH